ncbi:MAG: ATP-binding protein [Alteromonas sp.]|jgi:hypothetical protein|uniref:ATP-binding protein n=1 Tax=Alteromonas sp. TaxID=232 RepID=UPI0032D8E9B9|tara:strand:- start:13378 stop:17067 length:3690 start_codon:yes stop_codon:yes gene_type:complete
MNYLKKIILVNSWPNGNGKFKIIEVDGGTLLQGGNGAGKTSSLILSPLFYGAKPYQVMAASKKPKEKFAPRYLPTDSSYVVFEYIKNGEPKLVIVYTRDMDNLHYRFADTEFYDELFLDDDAHFIKTEQLLKHLTQRHGVTLSNQYTHNDYCEVIQSPKRVLKSNTNANSINAAKVRYSLCENTDSIAGSEKVALSIISSKPSFDSIKELIAQEVAAFGEGLQAQLSRENSNVSTLQTQANIIRQAKQFLTHHDSVQALTVLSENIRQLDKELGKYKHQAIKRYHMQCELITQTKSKEQESCQRFDEKQTLFNAATDKYNEVISKLKGEKRDKEKRINTLKEKYTQYQHTDIESKRQQAELLPSIEKEIETHERQLYELKSASKSITSYYDKLKAQAKESFNELKQAEQGKIATAKDDYHQQYAKLASQHQDTIAQLEADNKDTVSHIDRQRDTLTGSIADAKNAITHPQSEELTRLSHHQQQLAEALSDIKDTQADTLKAINAFSRDREDVERDSEKCGVALLQLQDDMTATIKYIEENKRAHNDVDTMLYFRLQQIAPDKALIASKALNRALLTSKVNNELTKLHDDDALLGFDIDVSNIASQPIKDKDELELERARLEQKLVQLEEKKAAKNQEKHTLDTQAKSLYERLKQAQRHCAELDRKRELTIADIARTEKELAAEKKQCIAQAKARLCELESTLKTLNEQKQNAFNKLTKQKEEAEHDTAQRKSEISLQLAEMISTSEAFISAREENLTSKLQSLMEKENRKLSESGAKVEAIRECEQAIEKLRREKASALAAKDVYSEYKRWLENDYAELNNFYSTAQELNAQLQQRQTKMSEQKKAFEAYKDEYKQFAAKLRKDIQVATTEVGHIEKLQRDILDEIVELETDETPPPADKITSYATSRFKQRQEQEKEGKVKMRGLLNRLRQNADLYAMCRELLVEYGFDDLESDKNWKALTVSLDHLMNGTLKEHITTISQQFRIKAQEMLSLYEKFSETKKRIEEVGRNISRQFNSSGTRFANIEQLEVKIDSDLHRLPFMKSLEKAASACRDAQIQPDSTVLTDAFFDIIARSVKDITEQKAVFVIEKHIEIVVKVKNSNAAQWRSAQNDKELEGISSEGLSFLILISLYAAIKNVIQRNQSCWLLWAVDEISRIHPDNAPELKRILDNEKIALFAATPKADPKVIEIFNHFYEVKLDRLQKFVDNKAVPASELLFSTDTTQEGEA